MQILQLTLLQIGAVAVGGAAGATARLLLSSAVTRLIGAAPGWGTLVVNLLGTFLLGFLYETLHYRSVSIERKLLLTTGFLGAFTTFSTFMLEVLSLIRLGEWRLATLWLFGSNLAGVALAIAGLLAARYLWQLHAQL